MMNTADTIIHQTIPQSDGEKKKESIVKVISSPS